MPDRLTIAGNPSLLRMCAPVVAVKRTHCAINPGTRGVIGHHVRRRVWAVHWEPRNKWEDDRSSPAQANALALDVEVDVGRFIAQTWLARTVGVELTDGTDGIDDARSVHFASEYGDDPATGEPVDCWYYMTMGGHGHSWHATDSYVGDRNPDRFSSRLPALDDIDASSLEQLEDGSLRCVALALKIICEHVASLPTPNATETP